MYNHDSGRKELVDDEVQSYPSMAVPLISHVTPQPGQAEDVRLEEVSLGAGMRRSPANRHDEAEVSTTSECLAVIAMAVLAHDLETTTTGHPETVLLVRYCGVAYLAGHSSDHVVYTAPVAVELERIADENEAQLATMLCTLDTRKLPSYRL